VIISPTSDKHESQSVSCGCQLPDPPGQLAFSCHVTVRAGHEREDVSSRTRAGETRRWIGHRCVFPSCRQPALLARAWTTNQSSFPSTLNSLSHPAESHVMYRHVWRDIRNTPRHGAAGSQGTAARTWSRSTDLVRARRPRDRRRSFGRSVQPEFRYPVTLVVRRWVDHNGVVVLKGVLDARAFAHVHRG